MWQERLRNLIRSINVPGVQSGDSTRDEDHNPSSVQQSHLRLRLRDLRARRTGRPQWTGWTRLPARSRGCCSGKKHSFLVYPIWLLLFIFFNVIASFSNIHLESDVRIWTHNLLVASLTLTTRPRLLAFFNSEVFVS